ncbi:protein Spindly [Anoplophora glabripennis]|uniref:protein Spindly n=1 Tax=Anoplophora glabripennis TaxID=217634 RepID=UPI0008747F98|nr:protein Spindly [Anoplophora glabripennis]
MANVSILPEDYEGLKKEYLVVKMRLDCVNQDLHESNRQLKIYEALQLDYQGEIEILQAEENSRKLKEEEKIAQLEENVNNVRSKYNKQIEALEIKSTLKEEEIKKLKAEIEFLKKNTGTQTPADDENKLLEELITLKHEIEVLLEKNEELELSVDILQKKCFSLEEAFTETKKESSNLKESLSCKREELMEANYLIQKLNDELFCLKSELESYKNKPLNTESKGNSLFAEVDDRRVYLQKTINTMKSEYIAMKQERAKHLNTISHLKKENKTLCEQWKMDMEEKEDDQHMVIKSYKDQIQILENLLEKYKEDLAAKPVLISTGTFDEIEFYQIMLNNKLKELEELRDQFRSRGLTHTLLSTALKEANKEIRKWRLEATLKQCQLEIQPGDTVSESTVTEKTNEVMGEPRIELKPTKKGPHLACRKEDSWVMERSVVVKKEDEEPAKEVKEVITINDSMDDLQVIRSGLDENQESHEEKSDHGILKNENIVAKTEDHKDTYVQEDPVCLVGKVRDDEGKENICEKAPRKVTFSQSTVSPKATDRTNLRANCRRIVGPKPIYIPSE